MKDDLTLEELRQKADDAIETLRRTGKKQEVQEAKGLVEALRNAREHDRMGQLAEAISRSDPRDAKNRRLLAQSLIETGKSTAAVDVLRNLARRLPRDHPEHAEASGLLGRAFKQVFFDAPDKQSPGARQALKRAIEAYRRPFEENAQNTWHGVNLVALVSRARRENLLLAADMEPVDIARRVIDRLKATPEKDRDDWFLPTLAEASLGLGDWDEVERNLKSYVAEPKAKAFLIGSTLRQFDKVWDIGSVDRGRDLLNILRARLAELPGGEHAYPPAEIQALCREPMPDQGQLEAVLGKHGPQTFEWWRTGLDRAVSVAAIWEKLGKRIGTGFLVRAGDFGLEPAEEMLVLTNFHVVNEHGASPGIAPEDALIVFEATDARQRFEVHRIVWSSEPNRHDASFLRLEQQVVDVAAMPIASSLPVIEPQALVYIVGHPRGLELQFSFQDNELLDHEGPPDGKPQIPGVCRVHYTAPTEGGSSGSPVFNARQWKVIALHHKGGKLGVPRLNGKDGTYGANEGISMQSIKETIAAV